MDKFRMTFAFRPVRKEPAAGAGKWRDSRPFEVHSRPERKPYRRSPDRRSKRDALPRFQRFAWLMPAALAVLSGMMLGGGVLFLFRSSAYDPGPSVTTVNPRPQGGAAAAAQSLPGLELVAYQVSAYSDFDRAKKGASEFEKIGVRPVLRNAGQIQLFVGIAQDKTQGQAVADALNQAKVPYYVKDYKVVQKKGVIQGIPAKDGTKLADVLTRAVQSIQEGIALAAGKTPDKSAVEAWSKRVQSLGGQVEMARAILEKAGKNGEVARLNDLQQQLEEAAAAMVQAKEILDVQRSLTQSVVDYEELINKLIP